MKTMTITDSPNSHGSAVATQAPPGEVRTRGPDGSPSRPEVLAAPANDGASAGVPQPPVAPTYRSRKWLLWTGVVAALAVGGYFLVPWVETEMNTVNTDDAYVNGHVTMVAPRVSGQVARVLVDDNQRVKKGDLLVRLDKQPFQVQVAIRKAAVAAAEADVTAANATVRGQVAAAKSYRFKLQHAVEDVNTQVANLRAAVATLNSKRATLALSKANLKRAEVLGPSGAITLEELDQRRQTVKVDQAAVDQALEQVYAIRVGLGLPALPPGGHGLAEVPPDLDQTYSAVTEALGGLLQSAAQFGVYPASWDANPKEALAEFFRRNPGDLTQILNSFIAKAPALKQAETRLLQARRGLRAGRTEPQLLRRRQRDRRRGDQPKHQPRQQRPGRAKSDGRPLAHGNLDRRQLQGDAAGGPADRPAGAVRGGHVRRPTKEFEGRITGFTMGTGQTLSLLPPQNATGNFVKIVQRLPVRIELTDYEPDKAPLFVGPVGHAVRVLQGTAHGPNAGEVLQPR